ncbi:MAG: hypothetical protein Ct9H90mP20_1870 [Candidatus Neomarinimicrobiota bacterium]|nr:MAG: hypothetical protein Ct9H90mP20_1870 [Candidatus Neomarinimicrobiota bacterium]
MISIDSEYFSLGHRTKLEIQTCLKEYYFYLSIIQVLKLDLDLCCDANISILLIGCMHQFFKILIYFFFIFNCNLEDSLYMPLHIRKFKLELSSFFISLKLR